MSTAGPRAPSTPAKSPHLSFGSPSLAPPHLGMAAALSPSPSEPVQALAPSPELQVAALGTAEKGGRGRRLMPPSLFGSPGSISESLEDGHLIADEMAGGLWMQGGSSVATSAATASTAPGRSSTGGSKELPDAGIRPSLMSPAAGHRPPRAHLSALPSFLLGAGAAAGPRCATVGAVITEACWSDEGEVNLRLNLRFGGGGTPVRTAAATATATAASQWPLRAAMGCGADTGGVDTITEELLRRLAWRESQLVVMEELLAEQAANADADAHASAEAAGRFAARLAAQEAEVAVLEARLSQLEAPQAVGVAARLAGEAWQAFAQALPANSEPLEGGSAGSASALDTGASEREVTPLAVACPPPPFSAVATAQAAVFWAAAGGGAAEVSALLVQLAQHASSGTRAAARAPIPPPLPPSSCGGADEWDGHRDWSRPPSPPRRGPSEPTSSDRAGVGGGRGVVANDGFDDAVFDEGDSVLTEGGASAVPSRSASGSGRCSRAIASACHGRPVVGAGAVGAAASGRPEPRWTSGEHASTPSRRPPPVPTMVREMHEVIFSETPPALRRTPDEEAADADTTDECAAVSSEQGVGGSVSTPARVQIRASPLSGCRRSSCRDWMAAESVAKWRRSHLNVRVLSAVFAVWREEFLEHQVHPSLRGMLPPGIEGPFDASDEDPFDGPDAPHPAAAPTSAGAGAPVAVAAAAEVVAAAAMPPIAAQTAVPPAATAAAATPHPAAEAAPPQAIAEAAEVAGAVEELPHPGAAEMGWQQFPRTNSYSL
mmetsp:Transcript_50818/g.164370  ORF Transcript_50818/g.164370 Transcript_50818/m.164370 type:complete len:776 (-) Transcript_50818:52-2379(-)